MFSFENLNRHNPEKTHKPHPFLDDRTFHGKAIDTTQDSISTALPETELVKRKKSFVKFETPSVKEKPATFVRPFDAQHHAPKWNLHPTIEQNKRLHEQFLEKETARKDLNVFHSGNIEEITSALKKEPSSELAKEITITKEQYAEKLSGLEFLNDLDWALFTAKRLSRPDTLDHEINTALKITAFIKREPIFKEAILSEKISFEEFVRACIHHDSGKLGIHEIALNDKTSQESWIMGFMALYEEEQTDLLTEYISRHKNILPPADSMRADYELMKGFFSENRIRAAEFVPIKANLNDDEIKLLKEQGINTDLSIIQIISEHEEKSEHILRSLGFSIEAQLAGNHHNYKRVEKFPMSSTLLRLGDMQEAMSETSREYDKNPPTPIRAIAFMIDAINNDRNLDTDIAALWIKQIMDEMKPAYLDQVRKEEAARDEYGSLDAKSGELAFVENFLKENSPRAKNNLRAKIEFGYDMAA